MRTIRNKTDVIAGVLVSLMLTLKIFYPFFWYFYCICLLVRAGDVGFFVQKKHNNFATNIQHPTILFITFTGKEIL